MTRTERLPVLFILGPSGSGKSSLGEWLQQDYGYWHLEIDQRDVPELERIRAVRLASEWETFLHRGDPVPLGTTLRTWTTDRGFAGVVLSFSSLRCLSVIQIESLRTHGIHAVILYGTIEDCIGAFLSRERQRPYPLDKEHWLRFNEATHREFGRPEFTSYRVDAFVSGVHRERSTILVEVLKRVSS